MSNRFHLISPACTWKIFNMIDGNTCLSGVFTVQYKRNRFVDGLVLSELCCCMLWKSF